MDTIIIFCSIDVYKKYFFCTFDGIFYLQGGEVGLLIGWSRLHHGWWDPLDPIYSKMIEGSRSLDQLKYYDVWQVRLLYFDKSGWLGTRIENTIEVILYIMHWWLQMLLGLNFYTCPFTCIYRLSYQEVLHYN